MATGHIQQYGTFKRQRNNFLTGQKDRKELKLKERQQSGQ